MSTTPTVWTFALPATLGAGELRTFMIDGQPWFAAADLAKTLGYSHTPSMVRGLDDDEAAVHKVHSSSSNGVVQQREILIVNQSGLFTLILNSRRDNAKPFRRWVTSEVLPSIARTGGYQDEDGAMDEFLRAATENQVGTAPQVPGTPGLPADIQALLTLLAPMFALLAPRLQDFMAAWLDKQTLAMLPRTEPAYTDEAWFHILKGQALLRSRTAVARELGVSVPQISQVLNFSGCYGDGRASPHTLAEKVLSRFAEPPLPLRPAEPVQTELL